jgi:hypothetical protein
MAELASTNDFPSGLGLAFDERYLVQQVQNAVDVIQMVLLGCLEQQKYPFSVCRVASYVEEFGDDALLGRYVNLAFLGVSFGDREVIQQVRPLHD